MAIWKFKSCPRCGGDIFIDRELGDWYAQCLQCGYLYSMPGKVKVDQHHDAKNKEELSKLSK
ncbi:MAG: hypothetical protein V3V23_06690 [Dehalococcoidales bacterium]